MWIANYVLMGYGEGAVMGVPAHDERDFEFATRAGIAIRTVVKSATGAYETVTAPWQDAYGEYGITVNSGEFSGLEFQAAVDAIAAALEARGIGAQAGAVPAAGLGYFAPAVLGLPDSADPLRGLRGCAGAG